MYHEHVAQQIKHERHRGALLLAIKFAIRNNMPAAYKRASNELRNR